MYIFVVQKPIKGSEDNVTMELHTKIETFGKANKCGRLKLA